MSKISSQDVKLISHRWAMHAAQALAQRDDGLLRRVFTEIDGLPDKAIDIQIQAFGCGAPLQFHEYGFFDESSSTYGTPLFEKAVHGDTLLLLALRRHDPSSAKALIECRASLEVANSIGECPMDLLFDAFAVLQLHSRLESDPNATRLEHTPSGHSLQPILSRRDAFDALFSSVKDHLLAHLQQIRENVQNELYRIYAHHAPERLGKVKDQMRDFEFREDQLLRGVQRKYES